MSNKCGKCGLPIHKSEVGVRHMGFTQAHSEGRCIELLRMRIDKLRAALTISRGQWIHSVNRNQCLEALGEDHD